MCIICFSNKSNYTSGGGVNGFMQTFKKHNNKLLYILTLTELKIEKIKLLQSIIGLKKVLKISLGSDDLLELEVSNQSIVFFKNDSSFVSRKTLTVTYPFSNFVSRISNNCCQQNIDRRTN